jgi:DNA modification methylase
MSICPPFKKSVCPPFRKKFSPFGKDLFGENIQPENQSPLKKRFIFPPFSVLDARNGDWQERKQAWIDYGIKGELGRGSNLYKGASTVCATEKYNRGSSGAGSVFDPVLCELVYRWFCPAKCHILDPFAGESTKGIIAAVMGYDYTGLELRQEQIDANYYQAQQLNLKPNWIQCDSAELCNVVDGEFDLIWTSPPYYDLEVYSNLENDGSTKQTYKEFMSWYGGIFGQAVDKLRENRFLAVKIGEIRDKETGVYRNFVGDNVSLFLNLGLNYYNEAILVTPCGSLPIRTAGMFESNRKLGKTHQNILVFYKGNTKNIKKHFPKL